MLRLGGAPTIAEQQDLAPAADRFHEGVDDGEEGIDLVRCEGVVGLDARLEAGPSSSARGRSPDAPSPVDHEIAPVM